MGNMGIIEIDGKNLITAEHGAVFRHLLVESGIDYPCGACVSYSADVQKFKPADFTNGKIFVVVKEKKASSDNTAALCLVHGSVNRDMLLKGKFSDSTFNSWENLTEEDFIKFLQNSNIM